MHKSHEEQARADGHQDAKDEEVETREMHYNEVFLKGLEVGNEERYAKDQEVGKAEGYAEGYAACSEEEADAAVVTAECEVFFRALHWVILLPGWRDGGILKSNGTANDDHKNWWKRALALYLTDNNL
jgi:hypothetical protein